MPAVLAPTTFSTQADESLAAPDIYNLKTAGTVTNALKDVLDGLSLDSVAGMIGSGVNTVSALVGATLKGLPVSADSLLKGVVASMPQLNGAVALLPANLKAQITANAGLAQVSLTAGGVSNTARFTDTRNLTSLGTIVSALSGSSGYSLTVSDYRGLTNLAGNVIRASSEAGLPGAYTAVMAGITDPRMGAEVTRDLTNYIVARSDNRLLAQVAAGPYAQQLVAQRPSFVQDYMGQYWHNQTASPTSWPNASAQVFTSFTQVAPRWKRSPYSASSSRTTLNMQLAVQASPAFQDLMAANAGRASVRIPSTAPYNTSYGAVPSNAPYDADMALIYRMSQALTPNQRHRSSSVLLNLAASLPYALLK